MIRANIVAFSIHRTHTAHMYFVFSPSVVSLDGSLHDQKSREKVDEDSPDPRWHQVSLRRPEVNVKHHDCYANAEKRNFDSRRKYIIINLYANIIQESENHEARNCIFCLSYHQHKVLLWEIVLQRNYPCSAQLFHKLHFSNINLSCRKDWFSPNKICLRGYLGGVVLRDHVFTAVCWWELHPWHNCQHFFKHLKNEQR